MNRRAECAISPPIFYIEVVEEHASCVAFQSKGFRQTGLLELRCCSIIHGMVPCECTFQRENCSVLRLTHCTVVCVQVEISVRNMVRWQNGKVSSQDCTYLFSLFPKSWQVADEAPARHKACSQVTWVSPAALGHQCTVKHQSQSRRRKMKGYLFHLVLRQQVPWKPP